MQSELWFYARSNHIHGVSGFHMVRNFVTNNSAWNQADVSLKMNCSIN